MGGRQQTGHGLEGGQDSGKARWDLVFANRAASFVAT